MTKIRPLPGFVLVEPIEDETTSAGGVYLPDSSKDKPSKGKVVDVVPESSVTRGQVVYYKKWVNETINYEGKELLFIKLEDLLGVEE